MQKHINTVLHDDVVSEVMTELAHDYWPAVAWVQTAEEPQR